MDFLIDVILDFFCVYNRDAKKTGKGWLYKFLLFMNVVAAGLVGQAGGVAATVLPSSSAVWQWFCLSSSSGMRAGASMNGAVESHVEIDL